MDTDSDSEFDTEPVKITYQSSFHSVKNRTAVMPPMEVSSGDTNSRRSEDDEPMNSDKHGEMVSVALNEPMDLEMINDVNVRHNHDERMAIVASNEPMDLEQSKDDNQQTDHDEEMVNVELNQENIGMIVDDIPAIESRLQQLRQNLGKKKHEKYRLFIIKIIIVINTSV